MAETTEPKSAGPKNAGDKLRDNVSDRVVEPMQRAGEALKASGEKMAERGSTVGLKVIDHAETNVREAFAAMRAAAQAKDAGEVMRIQSEYLREQGNRAMSQVREMGELIVQFGRESTAPFRRDG